MCVCVCERERGGELKVNSITFRFLLAYLWQRVVDYGAELGHVSVASEEGVAIAIAGPGIEQRGREPLGGRLRHHQDLAAAAAAAVAVGGGGGGVSRSTHGQISAVSPHGPSPDGHKRDSGVGGEGRRGVGWGWGLGLTGG